METVNIHEAKTHLSRLIERVARGESVVIAKAGRPVAKMVPLGKSEGKKPKRLGFMAGALKVPDDFDTMGREEIEALFGVKP
jgi:prevent-host-death family protein